MKLIADVTLDYFDMEYNIVFESGFRYEELVRIRYITFYVIFNNLETYRNKKRIIGEYFGYDRTTIYHAITSYEYYIKTDKDLKKQINDIQDLINKKKVNNV